MAGDMEKFLLEKLTQAIEDTKRSTEHRCFTKFFGPDDTYFQKLIDLLKNDAGASNQALGETKRREILYLLNNLVSEWQLISKEPIHEGIFDARRLTEKLKKIKKQLKAGYSNGFSSVKETSDVQDAQESLPETYRWSSRKVDPSKIYGLDDKLRFLERLLLRKESKDGFKAIAIVGILGIGKTTLCQMIFNNTKVKEEFLPRIWVCLSKQPDEDVDNRKEIVKRTLTCLGVEDEIVNEAAGQDPNLALQRLMFALRLELLGKKYLIVLDDAWNSDKCFDNLSSLSTQEESCYEQLAYGLPKGHGGTVIVTSRSEEIAKKMVGEENLHHMPALKDREIYWRIFMDSVEKDGKRFPEKLERLKDLIIDKCAGLPLAAKMMGEIMHSKLSSENPAVVTHQNQQNQNHQQDQQPPI